MGLLTLLLSFVFFAGVSMTVNEGLWNNTITVFIIIIAALIAIPWGYLLGLVIIVAAQAQRRERMGVHFRGVWGVFALSATIMRLIADKLSRVRMRFIPQLDKIGGALMGLVVATMFNSFVAYTIWELPLRQRSLEVRRRIGMATKAMTRAVTPINTAVIKFYGEFADLGQ